MAEPFFGLSVKDRRDALLVAEQQHLTGRRAYLLEKDVHVVWALSALFELQAGADLSFKGGTALSKVFGVISRFSEDVDVTYDIRRFLSHQDLPETGLPVSKSQASKLTKQVRERLPRWLSSELIPLLQERAERDGLVGLKFLHEKPTSEKVVIEFGRRISQCLSIHHLLPGIPRRDRLRAEPLHH